MIHSAAQFILGLRGGEALNNQTSIHPMVLLRWMELHTLWLKLLCDG